MSTARIAVLMAAYNAQDTIKPAMDSVLASTVPLDLYIIDDGSTLPVSEALGAVPENVFIHRLPENGGLPKALNAGLKIILDKDYEFIARFDADDYSYPERFAVQMEYLETHPSVQIVGAWANAMGEDPNTPLFTISHPEHHADIVRAMYHNAAFIHPTLFMRTSMLRSLDKHYDENFRIAQDYEFMARVIRHYETANVPQALIDYSYLSELSSKNKRRRQLRARLKVQSMHFTRRWASQRA
jgi:glycosyltransferase involved in cell wall biosynthesis